MRAVCQIICWLAVLLFLVYVGDVLDTAFWQAGIHARKLFADMPMHPPYQGWPLSRDFTPFLWDNHQLIPHVMILPWLVAITSVALSRGSPFELGDFLLRFLTVVVIEVGIFLVLLWTLIQPFVSYIGTGQPPGLTTVEMVSRAIFVVAVMASASGMLWRLIRWKRSEISEGQPESPSLPTAIGSSDKNENRSV